MLKLMRWIMILVIAGMVSMLSFSGLGYAEYKFGYVDINKVFNNYQKTIEADKALEKEQEKKQKEREKLISEIRKLKDEMELLSDEKKKEKQEQINRNIKELQEFDRQTRNELLKQRDDAAKEIIEELDKVIKEIGRKEGYTFIFNERFILYGEETHDLTDKVLKILNKKAR